MLTQTSLSLISCQEWLQQRKGQRGVPTDENDDKHVIQRQKLSWTVASHDNKRSLLLRLCGRLCYLLYQKWRDHCHCWLGDLVSCKFVSLITILRLLQNILHLVKIMLVLPISSAVCERGFSSVTRIKSDVRASLHTETVEELIRISVEEPQLEDYDARQDVKQWFSQGKRSRKPNYMSWPLQWDELQGRN